ncbi:MAG: hypothetical protein HY303_00615 [Candidatus Wallbacteria bacterium]|nr:hypothetical protein [Candidatus Wallbacteria bacterium]
MELLATAFQPYTSLPSDALASVFFLVVIAGAAIIMGIREIVSRGRWNQQFQQNTRLRLSHVLRSAARNGRPRGHHPQRRPLS